MYKGRGVRTPVLSFVGFVPRACLAVHEDSQTISEAMSTIAR